MRPWLRQKSILTETQGNHQPIEGHNMPLIRYLHERLSRSGG